MQHTRIINRAIIVVAVLLTVLAGVLVLGVPEEIEQQKSAFHEMRREAFEDDEWAGPHRGAYRGFHGFRRGPVVLPLLLVGTLAFFIARGRGYHGSDRGPRGESAIDHLREQYAAGDMTVEEFRERMRILTEDENEERS